TTMSHRILVSSNSHVISTLLFDPSSKSLSVEHELQIGYHPSWITPYPGDNSLIFTGVEHLKGEIAAVKIDETGKGVVVKKITSGGSDPCSLLATDDALYVANYTAGGVAIVPISSSPPYLSSSPAYMLEMSGTGPNKDRQETSHPHESVLVEDYNELLVPDLGADKVWRFKKESKDGGKWKVAGSVAYEPGSGPRHIVFREGFLYTLCELSNTLVKHRLPALPSEPEHIANAPTITAIPPPNAMFAAEILLPNPNSTFPTPYVYVSNRDDPSPEGDSISIFSIEEPGKLVLVNEVRTGLKHVRGMQFGGQDDKWLIVGG
ncbi:hypothetical protein M378DRAFT_167864, partial [Amanita muscaria Koide BX008]